MSKLVLGLAPTSVKLRVKLMNSSVTTGAGLTGLTNASSGLLISTIQQIEGANGEASATVYTGANIETIATLGTYAAPTGGKCRFKEVDATNHPGVYELQFADARFSATGDATKAMTLIISISGATNLAQADIEIECRNQAANIIQAAGVAWASGAITDGVFGADTYPKAIRTNTVNAGAAGYVDLDGSASAVDNFYVGCSIKITSGTGAGQSRTIILYVGSTKRAYVDRVWATNPSGSSTYLINAGKLTADVLNAGVAAAGGASTITLASSAVATNEYYDGAIVQIVSGTGLGQSRIISGYVGSTRVATVTDAWATQPDNTSVYMVRGLGDVEVGVNNDKTGYSGSIASGGITDASYAAATDSKALRTATAQAGSAAGFIVLDAGASATDDIYKGNRIKIVGGTGAGQSRTIILYNGTSKNAYVENPWTVTPDNSSVFVMTGGQLAPEIVHTGIAQAGGTAYTAVLSASASAVNNIYDGADITIISGAAAGQTRTIWTYDGATKTITVTDGWSGGIPGATSVYSIRERGDIVVGDFNSRASGQISAAVLITPANKLNTNVAGTAAADVVSINAIVQAAVQLAKSAGSIVSGTVDTTGFATTTTQFECSDITSADADFYKGRTVIFITGALTYQARRIVAYSLVGGRGHFTVEALTAAPLNGVTLVIV